MFCGFRKRRIKIKIITRPKKSSFDEKKKGNLFLDGFAWRFLSFLARPEGGWNDWGGCRELGKLFVACIAIFCFFSNISQHRRRSRSSSRSPSAESLSRRRWRYSTHSPTLITPVEPHSRRKKNILRKNCRFLGENMVKIYGFKLRLENTLKKKETQENPMRWHDVVTHTTKCRK